MAITLHEGARQRLAEILREELSNITVLNNSFLDVRSAAGLDRLDAALPEPLRTRLQAYMGDEPLSEFVIDRLLLVLERREYLSDAPAIPIVTLRAFEDVAETADRVLALFETLPWSYSVFIPLMAEAGALIRMGMTGNECVLSDNACVVFTGEGLSDYPAGSTQRQSAGMLIDPIPLKGLTTQAYYVNFKVEGYIPVWGDSRPLEDSYAYAKELLGLLASQRVIAFNQVTPTVSLFGSSLLALVYRKESDAWVFQDTHVVPTELTSAIRSLGQDDLLKNAKESLRPPWVAQGLSKIRAAFTQAAAAEAILRAAEWSFDSYTGSNPVLQFVQATVALEILFGDKAASDEAGLGRILGNRCAYLIGKTRKQRAEILDDFKKIYDTRSRIVHRGKNRLTNEEHADLGTLRWLCTRALQEELNLLAADKE